MNLRLEDAGHLEVEVCGDDKTLRRTALRWSRVHSPCVTVWIRVSRSPGGAIVLAPPSWQSKGMMGVIHRGIRYMTAEEFLSHN